MTTAERERQIRDCADIIEDALQELEYLSFDLDEDATAQKSITQLEIALGQVAEKLSHLSRELSAESFARNYPTARALGNGSRTHA